MEETVIEGLKCGFCMSDVFSYMGEADLDLIACANPKCGAKWDGIDLMEPSKMVNL